jgi:hypothetical protein
MTTKALGESLLDSGLHEALGLLGRESVSNTVRLPCNPSGRTVTLQMSDRARWIVLP